MVDSLNQQSLPDKNVVKFRNEGSWERLKFDSRGDERGQLVPIQGMIDVPFEIRRVYYLTHTLPNVTRGFHAHKKLDQVLIALTGRCTVMVDDGSLVESFELSSCTDGLRITDLDWRQISNFTPDCVLLVLASENYDVSDYVRDYEHFKVLSETKHY